MPLAREADPKTEKPKKEKLHKMHRVGGWDIVIMIVLAVFALLTLYPFWYVIIGSFNEGQDYAFGSVWIIPRVFTLGNYVVVVKDQRLWYSLRNTVIITALVTLLSLTFTSLVAYAMSRRELRFKKFFQVFNLFTMFFGGGLIPYFLVIVMLGLYNNFLVYIVPSCYSVYNMIVISSFFRGIPEELRESMLLDGAGEYRIWFTIYLPLSTPVLATVGLWVATGAWNSYFTTMMYTMGQKELMTLQFFLMKLIKEANISTSDVSGDLLNQITPQTVSFAAMVLASIPIVMVYPFIQKYFSKGIMIGALKG